jgi:hypothetical protein
MISRGLVNLTRWSCLWLMVGLSGVLFAKACTLPAVSESNVALGEPGYTTGFGALLFGFFDGSQALMPWSANIFWLASLVLLLVRFSRLSAMASLTAVICALSTLSFYPRSRLLEAYNWWLASMVALAVGCVGNNLWRRLTARRGF